MTSFTHSVLLLSIYFFRLTSTFIFTESDHWTLSNERDGVLKNYTLNDLRISIVYRARCFENEEEALAYRAQLHGKGKYSKRRCEQM